MIFSWKSQVSSIFIFHTFLTVLTAGCRQDTGARVKRHATGSAEGLKFALIKLQVRNNNSDLWFNSISIFHITGFLPEFFWAVSTEIFLTLASWFVLIFWFLSCVKLLIIGGRCFYWCSGVRITVACQLFLIIQLILILLQFNLQTFSFIFVWRNLSAKNIVFVVTLILKEARCHERWRYLKCTRERSQRRRVYLLRHRYSWRNNSTGCVTESYKYQMKHSAARLWKVRDLYFDLKG